MKKIAVCLITCLFITLSGCDKNQGNSNSLFNLKDELNTLANSQVDGTIDLDPCYENNPFDEWGQAFFAGMTKFFQTTSESKKLSILDRNDFEKILTLEIPEEYLNLDTINVNMKNVELIGNEFISLFVQRNIFETLQLSKKMEDRLIQSKILNVYDKSYLLKFVSLIRYSTYLSYTMNTKRVSYESCWKRKLQSVEDSGFFERVGCVIDWPMCLAKIAADCVLEVYF